MALTALVCPDRVADSFSNSEFRFWRPFDLLFNNAKMLWDTSASEILPIFMNKKKVKLYITQGVLWTLCYKLPCFPFIQFTLIPSLNIISRRNNEWNIYQGMQIKIVFIIQSSKLVWFTSYNVKTN